MVDCRICGGDGVLDNQTCGACGGSGQLDSNSDAERYEASQGVDIDARDEAIATEQEDLYGLSSGYMISEPDQFNKIKDSLKKATERSTYKPYFQMQQGAREGSFLSSISKQKSTGFASQDPTMMNMMEDEYARGMVGVAEDIQGKINSAQQSIDQIVQGNQQTILTLKDMENR